MPRRPKPSPIAPAAHWNQRQKLIEEFAALDREIGDLKPKLLRHEKLRQLILEWYPDVEGEEEITVSGVSCDILISSRDRLRTVSLEGKKKLYKLWGAQHFIARAHVLLKSLPDPKDESGLYTVQAPTGPRHLHVVARVRAAAASAA
jgi:hypothetical protein